MAGLDCNPNRFYVYVHRRKSDMRVFYVGKGSGKRMASACGRSVYWSRVVNKHGFFTEIVQSSMAEKDAFTLERILISCYGKDSLCNQCDGGEGAAGVKKSKDAIKKTADALRGRKRPSRIGQAVAKSRKGKPLPDETKEKISKAMRMKGINWQAIEAMRITRVGCTVSDETRKKIGAASKVAMSRLDVRQKIRQRICKIVLCSNGMWFQGTNQAAKWVRENTKWPKAGQQNIVNCCNGKTHSSYGYEWSYLNENT